MNKVNIFTYNWLAKKINNKSLSENLLHIKGIVLDLGCGETPYKSDILNNADVYFGVDWRNSFHDQSNVNIFADLTECLPLESDFANSVVSFQVMEHLPEPQKFLFEAFRVLKSEGEIVITVPFMWHVHEQPYDYYRYTRYGLNYLFNKAGFNNIVILENTGFWQMWILKFNYHTSRYAPGPLKILWLPFWWLAQVISPYLDKIDKHPEETAGYTIVAQKP